MSVSKSGSTRVQTAKLLATAKKLGLQVEVRAGWFLTFAAGQKSRRLLVHTGKKGTNCIELVGFEAEYAIAHPCPPAKTMTQMLDCNLPERDILRNFYKTARLLVPVEVKEEAPASSPAGEESTSMSDVTESAVLV